MESDELSYVPGRFVRRADGSVRYELVLRREGTPVVAVRGERISAEDVSDR